MDCEKINPFQKSKIPCGSYMWYLHMTTLYIVIKFHISIESFSQIKHEDRLVRFNLWTSCI